MASAASALVLNIGTLSDEWVEAMLLAGRSANRAGVPVVLDPVGAGATAYRTETARNLAEELELAVVRGNYAELATLAGHKAEIRGVDLSRPLAPGHVDVISYLSRRPGQRDSDSCVAVMSLTSWRVTLRSPRATEPGCRYVPRRATK